MPSGRIFAHQSYRSRPGTYLHHQVGRGTESIPGDFTKAEDAFRGYINAAPGEPNPHDSIADLYARMGQHEKAIEHYREALKANPTFTVSQRKIGDNLVFLGRYDEARKIYHDMVSSAKTPMARIQSNIALGRSSALKSLEGQATRTTN